MRRCGSWSRKGSRRASGAIAPTPPRCRRESSGWGWSSAAQEGFRLPQLTTVAVPSGIDEAKVRSQLLEKFNIEIGAGLGPLKGKVWRIGLMGESCKRENVMLVLSALETILESMGFEIARGKSLAAADRAYSGSAAYHASVRAEPQAAADAGLSGRSLNAVSRMTRMRVLRLERLAQMRIASGFNRLAYGLVEGRRGQRDNRRAARAVLLLPLPDAPHGRKAIHHRHLDVHQDQVVAAAQEFIDRDLAVLSLVEPVTGLAEIGANQQAVIDRIIGEQDSTGRCGRLSRRALAELHRAGAATRLSDEAGAESVDRGGRRIAAERPRI